MECLIKLIGFNNPSNSLILLHGQLLWVIIVWYPLTIEGMDS